MENRKKMEIYIAISFVVALTFTIVVLKILYDCLINAIRGYGYVSLVTTDDFNEFWFEFILLHVLIVLIAIVFIKQLKSLDIWLKK